MKMRRFFILGITLLFIFSLCGCGGSKQESTDATGAPATEAPAADRPAADTTDKNAPAADDSPKQSAAVSTPDAGAFAFDKCWDYDEGDYPAPNDDALEYWTEFKQLVDSGASYDEIIAKLSEVVAEDKQFVPGYVEFARYVLLNYYEYGTNFPPENAMNYLTEGYFHTGDPLLMELKESLGWNEFSKIIDKADEALRNRDSATAFELINSLPEDYSGIMEANRIIDILNKFDDAYYYLILGPALGNQYIVHFQMDGTFERVKMNEDGIHDTGTWEYELPGRCVRFAGLQFYDYGDAFRQIEYDSNYEAHEYELRPSKDGAAKEQFDYIANLVNEKAPLSSAAAALTANNWQVDEGWYYSFNDDGTGWMCAEDGSVSYGLTYFDHPEEENTVIIRPSDMPDDFNWIYDPATGSFMQESYGYDQTTDTAKVFYANVNIYNG